jgi:YD repeat-containing protein
VEKLRTLAGRHYSLPLLTCVLIALLAAASLSSSAAGESPFKFHHARPVAPSIAPVTGDAGEAHAAARPEPTASETAAAQQRSRTAYAGLSRSRAAKLLAAKFASLASAPPVAPLTAERARGRLRFVDPFTALLQRARGGSQLIQSLSGPLWAARKHGGHAPLDLSLRAHGATFTPLASEISMSLPRQLSKGARVDGVHIGFGADVNRLSSASLLNGKTFYANAETDSDVVLRPLSDGIDAMIQLRSRRAPEVFPLTFTAPRGARLRADGSAADLIEAGRVVGKILAPAGSDAAGKAVPAYYRIQGARLLLVVPHREQALTYPLLIDPVYEDWENGSNMWASGNPPNTNLFFNSGSGGAFAFATSGSFGDGLYAFEQGGQGYSAGALGQWYYSAHTRHGPSSYIAEADFYDMIGYYSGDACHDGVLRVGLWHSSPPGWDQVATFPGNSYPNNGGWALKTAEKIDDIADFGLSDPQGSACSTWEQAYLGGMFVIEDATSLPTIHFTPPSESTWFGPNRTLTTSASGEDTGLGLQWFDVYGPNSLHEPHAVAGPVNNPCSGTDADPCPQSATTSYAFNTNNLPDGADQFNIHSTNVLGDASSLPTWTVKVDKTAPTITTSGPLTEAPEARIGNAFYGLHIDAKDGVSGTASSGVKSIEVQVDGHQVASSSEGCSAGPCTASLEWSMNGQTYGLGEHTVTVVATDVAGNVATKVLKVTVVATGDVGWYALQEQTAGEELMVSVNPAGGDLELASEDIEPEAGAEGLSLSRFYNSQSSPGQGVPPTWGALGPHWSWSVGPDVFLRDLGSSVVLHGSSGYLVTLTRQPDGTYTAPEEFEGTLSKNADGSYTLASEEEGTYQFSTSGSLASYTNSEGATFKITNTTIAGQSSLQTLVPAAGKPAEVKYVGAHVSEVVAPDGAVQRYGFNAQGRLETYTEPKGKSTVYGYNEAGVLETIKTAGGTSVVITTSQGKTTSVVVTPKGESARGESFTYSSPSAPSCDPATDTGETVIHQIPAIAGETPETYCYDKLGAITNYIGPELEGTDNTENTGAPEEIPMGTCYETAEFTHEDCQESEPPSENGEGTSEGLLAPLNVSNLASSGYGIADNNRSFNTLGNKYFKALGVVNVRRTVRWDIATLPPTDPERKEYETWVTKVKALSKSGHPLISFERCPGTSTPDPLIPDPENPEGKPIPCSTAPTAPQYAAAIKAFLANPTFGGVQNFTPWNEPNNGSATSPTQPTWNQPKLAGSYWAMLKKACAAMKHTCTVGAGDFLDTLMKDAFHAPKPGEQASKGYTYFHEYVKGMGDPQDARHWAWHAYSDGEQAGTHFKTPSKWWPRFNNFKAAINNLPGNPPDIWLSEQGVRFSAQSKFRAAGKSANVAHHTMDAFVASSHQLTGLTKQITRFFYYEMRGDPRSKGTVDSGLLCPEKEKAYKCPPSQPRGIYTIYKRKTAP